MLLKEIHIYKCDRRTVYFTQFQSVFGENKRDRDCMSKEFTDLCLLLSSIFFRVPECCRTLCRCAANIACQLALFRVILSRAGCTRNYL